VFNQCDFITNDVPLRNVVRVRKSRLRFLDIIVESKGKGEKSDFAWGEGHGAGSLGQRGKE